MTTTPTAATPQFWRVRGMFPSGSPRKLDEVVYAAGNQAAEAAACALMGRDPGELLWASCMHISTPGFSPAPMPAVEFPLVAEVVPTIGMGCQGAGCHQGRQPAACDCHLATGAISTADATQQLAEHLAAQRLAAELDAATSGQAFDAYEAEAQARLEANTRSALRGADWLKAAAAVSFAAAAALFLSEAELPYSPSVASTVVEVLPR